MVLAFFNFLAAFFFFVAMVLSLRQMAPGGAVSMLVCNNSANVNSSARCRYLVSLTARRPPPCFTLEIAR